MRLVQLDCGVLLSSISLERISWYLVFVFVLFFCTEIDIKETRESSIWDFYHSLSMVSCASSNHIAGFFDHQYLWKESISIWDYQFWLDVTSWASCTIITELFDYQHLLKESTDILVFTRGLSSRDDGIWD